MPRSLFRTGLAVAVILAAGVAWAADAPLADAVARGDLTRVRTLIAQGADPNARRVDGTTALHAAVQADRLDLVEALLAAGASAAAADRYGVTPLYLASLNGNAGVIARLLDGGLDPNTVDPTGETALMTAARTGTPAALRVLLDRGARVDARDPEFQQTALMIAAREGHAAAVQLLLERKADANAQTRTGPVPPFVPPCKGTGCGSEGVGINRGGLPDRGRRLEAKGGMTALLYAARDGHLDVARLLVAAGADVELADANGIRPLLTAALNNQLSVARMLVERGAQMNADDFWGRSPLWAAVEYRNLDMNNKDQDSPTDNGVDCGPALDLVKLLLDKGANPNVRTREVPPSRRWLYSLNDVSWVDFTGQTPFLRAALSADTTTMRLLLQYGADPNLATPAGTTPLMAAAGVNWVVAQTYTESPEARLKAVELCLELGADINAANSMGLTALLGAANRGSNDIIALLATRGARLDVKDKEGRNALRWAEGVFLAAVGAERKPATIALLEKLGRTAVRQGCIIVAAALIVVAQGNAGAQREPAPPQETVDQYCATCHSDRVRAGGLSLAGLAIDQAGANAVVWEKAVRKLRTGMMPPAGAPRPERAVLDGLAAHLETVLDRRAASSPDPGTRVLSRLNRTEYATAVRDLLDLPVDPAALLPGDDSAEGFDNIASVLSVSPALMQAYVSAAAKISRLAVGDPTTSPGITTYAPPRGLSQAEHREGQPLGTRGGIEVQHVFPLDAEYDFRVGRTGSGFGLPAVGGEEQVEISLDGERLRLLGREARDVRLKIPAGPHRVGVAVVRKANARGVDDLFSEYAMSVGVSGVSISGPFAPTGPGDTPSRRRIFVCRPASSAEETPCARRILARLATRAWRRPVADTDATIDTLFGFYRSGHELRGFEAGIQYALARLLVDPQFIFRFEREPASLPVGAVYRVTDLELASRLSFFLWSSLPDEELLAVASGGGLKDRAVLEQQTRRMLADERAQAMVDNLAGQWLLLRDLENASPATRDFDGNLRYSFTRETELLFESILKEDRSILDLLRADYTFLDERLARHYGIPNVRGSRFRRVTVTDDARRGLLGHGSVLTATSVGNRTSPVKRGKWILENLLGAPVPSPPPGVEVNLEPSKTGAAATSLRQRMERHRASPACASCHAVMDPIGFSLEHFDLAGKWRDTDGGVPVATSGRLADGTAIDGPASLRQALLDRKEAFAGTAAERLLTYALGRKVEHFDMPAVRGVVRTAARDDYRFSALVVGIVQSAPFQMKKKVGGTQP